MAEATQVRSVPDDARPLLEIHDLVRHFDVSPPWLNRFVESRGRAVVKAVDGVDFRIGKGETFSLVGESGCGKSTVARLVVGLYRPTAGSIRFDEVEIGTPAGAGDRQRMQPRMQMIFQDPYGSLNPRLTAGEIIAEPLIIHHLGNARERQEKIEEAAGWVGLDKSDLGRYPHQFSGGQRQRIAIARAIIPEPSLIIADEPLSALDMSVQSQAINLLMYLGRVRNLTYLFITHDLGVVRYMADRVAVMYLGRIVELAPAGALFESPLHPYSRALIQALPRPGGGKRQPGSGLEGDVPSPINPPPGCAFHPRCEQAAELCRQRAPRLEAHSPTRWTACHFADLS